MKKPTKKPEKARKKPTPEPARINVAEAETVPRETPPGAQAETPPKKSPYTGEKSPATAEIISVEVARQIAEGKTPVFIVAFLAEKYSCSPRTAADHMGRALKLIREYSPAGLTDLRTDIVAKLDLCWEKANLREDIKEMHKNIELRINIFGIGPEGKERPKLSTINITRLSSAIVKAEASAKAAEVKHSGG